MATELLPIFALGLALVAMPALALRTIRRRQGYCGQNSKQCGWCRRHCEYYAFVERDTAKTG